MTKWICHYCPYAANSYDEMKSHELKEHNSYYSPELSKDLTVQTIESFRTTKRKVHHLLQIKPSTRGDDMLLYLEFMKYFEKALIYTPESQRISFANPSGVTYEEFMFLTSWETVRRTRQKIQEQDKKLYHNEDGTIKKEHECLLGSERTTLKRARREIVLRNNMRYL